jgi:hypothetical protein
MIVFLLVFGVIIGMAAVNGKIPELGAQLNKDILGANNQLGFAEWAAAILAIAILTKSVDLPGAGRALMVLVVLAFLLSDQGLLTQIEQQFATIKNPVSGSAAASVVQAPPAGLAAGGPPTKNILADMATIPGAENALRQIVEANSPSPTGGPFG